MTGKRWDSSSVTTQFRLTSLRLGQLQERQDYKGAITRKDIATLLQQRNISLARAKARGLQREDALGDLSEILEMFVGQLLEHFQELDQNTHLSPNVIEAASTIIYAAPYVGLKDLEIVSHLLTQHLGPEFARSAVTNNDGHVAAIAIRTTTTLPPSARDLDLVLRRIASEYGITWTPEPLRQDILKSVSEILDPQTVPVLDLQYLRRLCRRGIPDEPRWLRPRIWKLLFGVLPAVKASRAKEIESQRNTYYGLVQRLLDPLSDLSAPDPKSNSLDSLLLNLLKQLSTTPSNLFGDLGQPPDSFTSCPLDDNARDEIKLNSAKNLDLRIDILHSKNTDRASLLPDKASPMVVTVPEISLLSPDEGSNSFTTTLLSFKSIATNIVHPKHFSALLRMLYAHASINPGNISPHNASLLVPLYVVLNHEVIPDELAHVEADTFWLFEAMMGEFSDLENTECGSAWMKTLSDRLAWADSDLFNSLQARGLDPALPHYSYQWLAPLLTHTLPLSSVLPIWDTIFSCPTRTRDVNPKVDHLVNVCTAMLIRVRETLCRLGRNGSKPPSLWSEEQILYTPLSPLHPGELEEAFMEGLAFLQRYPVDAAGGIDIILQDAFELALRRDEETGLSCKETPSLGTRIKGAMWKVTNQGTPPEESEDEENSHTDNPNSAASGLTSKLASTIWRGITNQTSMESPPSPDSPPSPSTSFLASIIDPNESGGQGSSRPTSNTWAYADKIIDSDTMNAIAKASSNRRAKSILGLRGLCPPLNGQESSWFSQIGAQRDVNGLPSIDSDRPDLTGKVYSSPYRSHHFRPLQDSFVSPRKKAPSPKEEGDVNESFDRTYKPQSSLVALTRTFFSQAAARSGPRPLLLSPSALSISPIRSVSQSTGSFPAPDNNQWVDVMRLKGHNLHRDSISSVSSLSPSDALRSTQSTRNSWDSDTGTPSRRVLLNRKSVSPMAPNFRCQRRSQSFNSFSGRGLTSPPASDQINLRSWENAENLDSASHTSLPSDIPNSTVIQELRKIGVQPKDSGFSAPKQALMPKKLTQRNGPSTDGPCGSPAAQTLSWSPRLRTKRHVPRPLDLDLKGGMERKLSVSNHLGVEWPSSDHEVALTPRASSFEVDHDHSFATTMSSKSSRCSRKASGEAHEHPRHTSIDYREIWIRKASTGQRSRKSSSDQGDMVRQRESLAEGDDEDYDDLLSAYESENFQVSLR